MKITVVLPSNLLIRKMLVGAISYFAVFLAIISTGTVSAAEQYQNYVMDQNYFSCEIPTDWDLVREKEKDEEYHIYEIMLLKTPGASIYVSYYAEDNEDFIDYKNFLARNSKNILGETKNSRENYGPIKETQLNGGKGFELERERLVYLSLNSKSDASEAIKELLYVLPAATGGFYVLHYTAPKESFEDLLPVFKKVTTSFQPQKTALNDSKIKNYRYYFAFSEKFVEINDGSFVSGSSPDDYISARIEHYLIGDLNKDGNDDAAIILSSKSMGSGNFYELTALILNDGKINQANSIVIGDRIIIESLSIKFGEIILDLATHKPDDPSCCPTKKIIKRFKIDGHKLVEIIND